MRKRDWDWWNDTDDMANTPIIPIQSEADEVSAKETVLVVDDEPMVRSLIVKIIRSLGYRVLEASGAAEAQQLSSTNKEISLLLTDFNMPQTNGLELARWFQRKCPEIKVVIATGSLWELANQVGEQEHVAILPKPFDTLQLGRMVQRLLGEMTVGGGSNNTGH